VPDELDWDPFDRDLHRSPYDMWRRMRDESPVYHNRTYDFYALSRFADVHDASLDTETFSSAHGITLDMIQDEPLDPPSPMIMLDPPAHTSMRKIVNRTFTPRRMAQLDDRIHALCDEYLDPFVGSDGFDYVRDFSMRLPVMVISTLLGFPRADHDQLRVWSDAQIHREPDDPNLTPEGQRAFADLMAYYSDQVARRRRTPTDDIVSDLMAADLVEPDGTTRKLDDGELLVFMALINLAGNETVARLLGWAALTLARFPDERAKLVADPSRIPAALEELLRFEAPSPVQGRFSLKPATFHGVDIPAGSKVLLVTGAAGRDEREYPDPDRFDVDRQATRHVSFGHGAHFCLGAALARVEGRVGIAETLRRFPTWEVDESTIEYVHTNSVRGPASLPISLR
jgi:cytochrome P450